MNGTYLISNTPTKPWHYVSFIGRSISLHDLSLNQLRGAAASPAGFADADPSSTIDRATSPPRTIPSAPSDEASANSRLPNRVHPVPPALLQGTDRVSPVLVEAVAQLLNHPEERFPGRPPEAAVAHGRGPGARAQGQVRDIVVQAYYDPLGADASPRCELPTVIIHAPAWESELTSSADQFLGLMYDQVVYFGPKDEVAHEQRAFQAAINGDMTLLREQTIDPLHLLVVMPHGGTLSPV